MPVRVLIVDDSVFFRNRISLILKSHPGIEVIDVAKNGVEAVEKVQRLHPDVVTMDVEMPEMDGITALKQIMIKAPCQVLMLSSLTRRSAVTTLEALECGAADYMEKDARLWVAQAEKTGALLTDKVLALGSKKAACSLRSVVSADNAYSKAKTATVALSRHQSYTKKVVKPDCRILTIGSSTGGPAALQEILPEMKADFPAPILLTQHMPKTFTSVFAKRLNDLCQIQVKEAEDGDHLMPGHAYLAPGGQQMILDPGDPKRLKVRESDDRINYKPSVDLTFASVAKAYGNHAFGLVLTGMGSDGCDGARVLKKVGATVWAQDQASCTIFGMPKAVITAGLADEVLGLQELKNILGRWSK
ncbi:protein-glutamate methylesterase/protein-glutamine glutaminase [Amphritea balenae]|uniref:Protein-glutamate methylesterase/protein-glutamine glutaminase n=1 Tax=Amphritea balenae TaxID=452629 RepID=A0A3P1SPX0_9GAMM|nr:chemotaxis response regulator protein-glutamate methylesterase [Amphritea balenae]RRC99218.1 chemotaxis response regulator protein-glutamate methylesterase [Amphritea balenae]GGK72975.1 chemotaxis response regulator protein-glutamate methylesterase of group 1 operon [Amphritea balenae]